jgi:hypothetical protein
MEPFDLNTLVEYGFPNPDYFNFDDGSLTYGNYGGKNYSAGEFGGTITGTPEDPPPVDAYDQEFYEHDLVAQTSSDPEVLLQSHVDVVQDVARLLANAFSALVADLAFA